jgi:hypothetical protein
MEIAWVNGGVMACLSPFFDVRKFVHTYVHADVTALAAEGLLEREGGRLRADYDVIETKIAL